jgi:hypothetical protein
MAKRRKANEEKQSKWLAELDALRTLDDGWDSYSAPAPHSTAIENAKTLLSEADKLGLTAEHVEPSAMGGVGVTFCTNSHEVVIEFYNRGTAHALFSNEMTGEMKTLAVATNQERYRDGSALRELTK